MNPEVGSYVNLRDGSDRPDPVAPVPPASYAVGTRVVFRKLAGLVLVDIDEPVFFVPVTSAA